MSRDLSAAAVRAPFAEGVRRRLEQLRALLDLSTRLQASPLARRRRVRAHGPGP